MNLQSILLLILILASCAYIIYTRFIKKSEGGCPGCDSCATSKNHDYKSSSCH